MEEWRNISGYEGYYEVSTDGRIRGCERTIVRSDGQVRVIPERILTPVLNTDGYQQCKLSKDGKYKTVSIHQVVAQTFIPNPNNLKDVNHKNFNRTDNRVDNLEWLSHGDNVRYSIKHGRHVCTTDLNGANNPNYKSTTLKKFYMEHPDEALRILSRPRGQNGRAKRIKTRATGLNSDEIYFDCLLDCAEFLISVTGMQVKAKSLAYRISKAATNGTLIHGYAFEFI